MQSEDFSQSFLPILGESPKILFLGTMPGKESLRKIQYYAHPQNQFWKILFHIFNFDFTTNYKAKIDFAKLNKFALWDVCYTCFRKGSLDTKINNEIPNKMSELLLSNPTIQTIIFNGQKAEKLYKKHFEINIGIKYFTVLSSSPANASFTFEQKLKNWEFAIYKWRQY